MTCLVWTPFSPAYIDSNMPCVEIVPVESENGLASDPHAAPPIHAIDHVPDILLVRKLRDEKEKVAGFSKSGSIPDDPRIRINGPSDLQIYIVDFSLFARVQPERVLNCGKEIVI